MARIVFLGTPTFAVPVLEACIAHHHVVAVVTQPDQRAGRGRRRLCAPPVKSIARAHGIAVHQPERLRRDPATERALREAGADLFVLAAYGQILPQRILDISPRGCIGVHASLLPKLRGAAPIARAILDGETETGITLMLTEAGMDTGPIIAQRSLSIASDDTTETLTVKLAKLGADLLIDTLPSWLAGAIAPTPQDDARATYAPCLGREDAEIDWRRRAVEIDRQIRATTPWPGAYTRLEGQRLKVLEAHTEPDWEGQGEPGRVVEAGDAVGVVTADGLLILDRIQLAGRKALDIEQFCRGQRGFTECTLGEES
jgi:methionyl-tRNA formyltransferase